MKKIFFVLMVTCLNVIFTFNVAHAEEKEIELKGKYDITQKNTVYYQAISTFSTNDYRNGLFDGNYVRSTSFPRQAKDNDLTTSGSFGGTVVFDRKINITGAYLKYTMDQGTGSESRAGGIEITCLNDEGKTIQSNYNPKNNNYTTFSCLNTKSIVLKFYNNPINYTYKVFEFEVLGEPARIYEAVSNVVAKDITDSSFVVEYENPDTPEVIANEIYLDNVLIHDGSKVTRYKFENLQPEKKYNLRIDTVYDDGQKISFATGVTTLERLQPPADVTKLKAVYENDAVKLTYEIPKDTESVKIYKESALLTEVTTNSYSDKEVEANRTYIYKVIAVNKKGQSNGATVSITIPSKEVTELKAKPSFDRVDLSWKLPTNKKFNRVVIYRTDLSRNVMSRMFTSMFSKEEPLFETDGTYFNDLTVKSDTKYRYRVASVIDGVESSGITVDVTTLKQRVEGGNVVENENGDFTVTWTTPTKGQIKVYVGGELYATVDAVTKKYTIPGKDMKYTQLGGPDVKLMPIAEDGTEGELSTPGGTGLTPIDGVFDGDDLLGTAMQLVALVGGLILLSLSFPVVRKLIKLIRNALSRRKENAMYEGRRRIEE